MNRHTPPLPDGLFEYTYTDAGELVAMCRAVYGPQATVYMRTKDQAACDPRGVEGGR